MPGYSAESENSISEAQKMLNERMEARAKANAEKAAAKKSFWDKYYEQLKKMTPNQGGAHAKTTRIFRVW